MKSFLNFQQLRFGLRILTLGLLTSLAATVVARQKNDNAYVVNVTTVSVIDTKTNVLTTTLAPPMTGPPDLVGGAVTPEGNKVYLTNAGFALPTRFLCLTLLRIPSLIRSRSALVPYLMQSHPTARRSTS
jgi:hypothetical protein